MGDTHAPPAVHDALKSSGRPLDTATRSFMESRFDHDFRHVRVHTNSQAVDSARSVNALAYTVGNHIVFGAGQYAPGTQAGKKLLAHEMAHTIQQNRGKSRAQRNTGGLQRQCTTPHPPALTCDTFDPTPPAPSGPEVFFGVGSSTLDTADRTTITAFVSTWRRMGARNDVKVHGFASTDGNETVNWRISCARAEAVEAEMVAQGVFSTRIETLAHCESTLATTANGNRRAVLEMVPTPSQTTTSSQETPSASQTRQNCGPDITDWFVNALNNAKHDRCVLEIKRLLRGAARVGRRYGYSSTAVLEGGLVRKVLAAERAAGNPPRTQAARQQIAAADPQNQFGRALAAATAPIPLVGAPEQLMLVAIRRASLIWKRLVETNAIFDFKNNILSGASLADAGCRDQCSLPPTLNLFGTCYEHDLPGNIFYAYIGRFCGFSLNALQLGSQFAELQPSSSSNWDTPEDTAMINLGFNLPTGTITRANLQGALNAARNSLTIRQCNICPGSYNAGSVANRSGLQCTP